MQDYSSYVSPFSARYASPQMQYLFSQRHRSIIWRKLWLILAESEKELGLNITDEQIAEMKANIENIDFDAISSYEKELRHDVMAHVYAFGDVAPKARPIIHLGATSCYVGDNADIIILKDALGILLKRLVDIAKNLAKFAHKYKDMPTLGYTHFQPAQPTTVGKRACLWLQDVLIDIIETDRVKNSLLPLGCKGTTGTQASFLELFDGDYEKVKSLDEICAKKMGFEKVIPVSGQTYTRKQDSIVLNLLSQIAQTTQKFSNDIRLLQHLKEIEEPFEKKQIGSSAMPYKRNPMRTERMAALSRFIISNAQNAAFTAAEQWFERTLDDSANRRFSLSEGCLAADSLLILFSNVSSALVVYPAVIEKHLKEELPFMMVENILMEAVKRGGDRQSLHEKLRKYSMLAGKSVKEEGRANDLIERILSDEDFSFIKDDLDSITDTKLYIGCAEKQVEEFLSGEVKTVLAAFDDMESISAELKV